MSLAAGSRIGPYEILAPLGAGGMGEVYRARDPRLGREVAIKVLPKDRLTDESRRLRLQQEARAASALNHPNIVTVHEIGFASGADFIVMEYVPGKSLEAMLRQRMRLPEAIRIAGSIADALARAHAAGIIHRDLKPANVVVTPEGVAKVLDFGLAKLVASEESTGEEDTATEGASARFESQPGTIAGTPAYMSPEQATGGKVDARSDVFAFGSLLYQLATGRRAFAGGSREDTLAAVVRAQPAPPCEVAPGVPKELERLILRCLRREPEKRFQHMADVKVELDEILGELTSAPDKVRAVSLRARRILLAAGLAGGTAAGGFWLLGRAHQTSVAAPQVVPLTAMPGFEGWPSFSPDGSQIAFSGEGERATRGEQPPNLDIWLKMIGSSETRRLTTDPAEDALPSWSPDGLQIAFLRRRPEDRSATIHLVSPLGGADRKVADFPAGFSRMAWSPDGRWLAVRRARVPDGTMAEGSGGIHLVPLQLGESRAISFPKAPGFDAHPAFSPDGRRLAYASCAFDLFPPCDVYVVDLGRDFTPTGPARRLTRQPAGIAGLAWSRDGRSIIYSAAQVGLDKARLWRVEVEEGSTPQRLELAPQGAVSPATVPSRDRLAFGLDRSDWDIYRFVPGYSPEPVLVSSFFSDYNPSYSPDGRRIAFESGRSGQSQEIWLANPDGSDLVQLTHGPGVWQGTPRFSPDGRQVVFSSRGQDGFTDLWVIDTDGGALRRLTHGPFHEGFGTWSHDGRWIYYREDRADGRDIARVPAAGGASERLTRNGGLVARESADGQTLYYTQRDSHAPLFSLRLPHGPEGQVVDCVGSRSLDVGAHGVYYVGCVPDRTPVPIFRLDPGSGHRFLLGHLPSERSAIQGIAVSPDGRSILYATHASGGSDLMLIENFR